MIPASNRFRRLAALVAAGCLLLPATGRSQEILPPGHRPIPPGVHALVGARIVVEPGVVIEKGVVVVRDGVIESVGATTKPPADARIWDLSGCVMYAGFIDPHHSTSTRGGSGGEEESWASSLRAGGVRFFGVPGGETDPGSAGPGSEVAAIGPERRVAREFKADAKRFESLREAGFTAAQVVPEGDLLRGTGALVLLAEDDPNRLVVRADVFQHASLEGGRGGRGDEARPYPTSLMGRIAALRQALFDARHYEMERAAEGRAREGRPRVPYNPALEALGPAIRREMRVLIETTSVLMVDQASRIAREHDLDLVLLGSGQEWRRPDLVRAAGAPMILPLAYPELPRLPEEEDWDRVGLDSLRAWDWAPENPALVRSLGLEVALTQHGLADAKRFRKNLRLAIDRGLSEDDALAGLTTVPARLCGVDDRMGTIAPGKMANLTIVEGAGYFDPDARVRSVWIEGREWPLPPRKPEGAGKVGEPTPPEGESVPADRPADVPRREGTLADLPKEGEGAADPGLAGERAVRELRKVRTARAPLEGRGPLAAPPAVLVQGATVWTCGPRGTLYDVDFLCVDGRIRAIGHDLEIPLEAAALIVVDGRGLHVTPGLIDCHSHAAIIGGVNESAIPSSAMVRIGDVVNSETGNLLLHLAGGLTTANLLHGSANPIGGQNCVIKLRDGATPEGLKFAGAPPGIKFALGENVKQSNWGDKHVTRFPQTRMGVRTFFANRFEAARQYLTAREEADRAIAANPNAQRVLPRRDLELEALGEILRGERLIHCHSYRQDEILMLIRLMDRLGVRIGTFQHVLEGYKVADEIAAHGAGGSCFTDWWAYKFEVYDAIPYAGALMHQRGVVTSFNSDSVDLARRMHMEAAKAVKYGGISEEDALRFVTLYPARQLRIDDRVGSLEPGKDADFVVWSAAPLDSRAVCRETWIEGRKYFDVREVPRQTEERRRERDALLDKAKRVQKVGGAVEDGKDAKAVQRFFARALEHQHDGMEVHCMGECNAGAGGEEGGR